MLALLPFLACSPELPPVYTSCEAGRPASADRPVFSDTPRDLLMISIDTLRRDRVGRYGCGGTTPFLDDLLARSFVFDDHHSCSDWTWPSVLCALGGRSTVDMGFHPVLGAENMEPLPEGIELLADWLGDGGWDTALVSTSFFLDQKVGMTRGYARAERLEAAADAVVDRAIEILPELREPWFLHLHFIDPHAPYDPPDAYLDGLDGLPAAPFDLSTRDGLHAAVQHYGSMSDAEQQAVSERLRVRYEGEIRYMDDQLSRLWSSIDLPREVLVVLWSDHGEQFWDHGSQGHGIDLFPEETSAVAAMWSPLLAPGSTTLPTTHADLVPTILQAMDLPVPGVVTGLDPSRIPEDRALFDLARQPRTPALSSVRRGDSHLVLDWSGSLSFFRTDLDPGETHDVYDPDDPGVIELRSLLGPEVARAEPVLGEAASWP